MINQPNELGSGPHAAARTAPVIPISQVLTIYPRGIVEYVKNDPVLREQFAHITVNQPLHIYSGPETCIPASADFETWLFTEGMQRSVEVKKYVMFLSAMTQIFNTIQLAFPKQNPGRENLKDHMTIGSSPQEMLYIAKYLYYLDSYGVPGDVLECGCFKGFSSCCLSWACNYLGKKLYVADSFEGLPDVGHAFYAAHDFKGSFDEVEANITSFGRVENVEWIKGWFADSLVGFQHPLCLLWMDVDLYQSTMDVMNHAFAALDRNGVIFSHELHAECIAAEQISPDTTSDVSKALKFYFESHDMAYKAKFLAGCTGIIIPRPEPGRILLSASYTNILDQYRTLGSQPFSPAPALTEISPVAPKDLYCWLDSINSHTAAWHIQPVGYLLDTPAIAKEDEILHVSGWAYDIFNQELAGAVYIDIDGTQFLAQPGLDRVDVARKLNSMKFRLCGFELRIPIALIGLGPHTLTLKILTRDKKAYYAPSQSIQFIIV